jgi:ribosomal protein S27E
MPFIIHLLPKEIKAHHITIRCPRCDEHTFHLYRLDTETSYQARCAECFMKLITGEQVIIGES